MLRDTSKARMTVPSLRGRPTSACGRASPITSSASPTTQERAREPPPDAGRRVPPVRRRRRSARSPRPAAAADARARDRRRHRAGSPRGAAASRGQSKVIGYASSLAARREPDDRPDQVLVGRQRHQLRARPRERRAELDLALPRGRLGSARGTPGRGCRCRPAHRSRRPRRSSGRCRAATSRAGPTAGRRPPRGAG